MEDWICIQRDEACTVIGGTDDKEFKEKLVWVIGRLLGRMAKEIYDWLSSGGKPEAATV